MAKKKGKRGGSSSPFRPRRGLDVSLIPLTPMVTRGQDAIHVDASSKIGAPILASGGGGSGSDDGDRSPLLPREPVLGSCIFASSSEKMSEDGANRVREGVARAMFVATRARGDNGSDGLFAKESRACPSPSVTVLVDEDVDVLAEIRAIKVALLRREALLRGFRP